MRLFKTGMDMPPIEGREITKVIAPIVTPKGWVDRTIGLCYNRRKNWTRYYLIWSPKKSEYSFFNGKK